MRARRASRLRCLLAFGALGCSGGPAEAPSAPHEAPGAQPSSVYRVVRDADGERFIGEPGAPELRWEGRKIVGPKRSVKARARWTKLGELLVACVGDPLSIPPAGDPGGFRKLVWAEEPVWWIDLSGMNRCSLEGRIELDVRRNSVPRAELVVDGLPWREGGMEKAQEILDAALRAEVVALWPTLPLDVRIVVLKRLSEMPDGDTALLELAALKDENRPEVEAALGRWRDAFGGD